MKLKNSMKCKELNEGKTTFNEIKKFNEMQELNEGKKTFNERKNLFNEIKKNSMKCKNESKTFNENFKIQ
jgi:hypothetical protein